MEPEPANLAGDQKRRSRRASTKWVSAPSLPFDLSSWQGQRLSSVPEFRGFTLLPSSRHLWTKRSFAQRVINGFEGFTLSRQRREVGLVNVR